MPELSLMQLSEREASLLDALTYVADDCELIEEDEQARIIDAYIEANDDFKNKVDRYVDLYDAFTCRAMYQEHRAQNFSELARRNRSVADKLKARLKAVMELRGETKIETDNHRLSLVNNGGTLPMIINPAWIADPASAPEQFHKHEIKLDTKAIREAIRNDEPVEGCRLGERGTNLRIL